MPSQGNPGKELGKGEASASASCLEGEDHGIPSEREGQLYEAIHHCINGAAAQNSHPRSRWIGVGGAVRNGGLALLLTLWSFTPAREKEAGKVISLPRHGRPLFKRCSFESGRQTQLELADGHSRTRKSFSPFCIFVPVLINKVWVALTSSSICHPVIHLLKTPINDKHQRDTRLALSLSLSLFIIIIHTQTAVSALTSKWASDDLRLFI